MFALVLLVVAATEKVSGDCDEICFKLRTSSSSYLPNSCNCPPQDAVNLLYHPPRPRKTLNDLSIFYEPVGSPLFSKEPYFKTPFLIHNPTSVKNTKNFERIIVNTKIKQNNNAATRNTVPSTLNKQFKKSVGKSNEDLSQIYDNSKHYLSVIETTKNDSAKPTLTEIFLREEVPTFIDIEVKKSGHTNIFHNYPFYEKLNFTEKDIEECIDLHIIIYLRQNKNNYELNSMWKTKYIKKYMHYNGTEIDEAINKKCKELSSIVERSLKEIEHSWPKKEPTTNNDTVTIISENLPNQYNQPFFDEESIEEFKKSSHNSIENKSNLRLSAQTFQTQFFLQSLQNDSNQIVNPKLQDLKNEVHTHETFRHSKINQFTKNLYDASSEQETQRQGKEVDPNFNIETVLKEKSLHCDNFTKKFEHFPLTSKNTQTSTTNNDYLDRTTYITLSQESTSIESTSTDSSFDDNTEATITHEHNWRLPSNTIEHKSALRNKFNQREISIQRIITKELRNNTVTSDTYGNEPYTDDETDINIMTTEKLPIKTNKQISERNDEDLNSANSLYYTSTDLPTNFRDTVQNVNQEITGKLYFVFKNYSVPVKFIQERDARLRLGIDAMALCDKLTKDKPSILISALCNLPKNT